VSELTFVTPTFSGSQMQWHMKVSEEMYQEFDSFPSPQLALLQPLCRVCNATKHIHAIFPLPTILAKDTSTGRPVIESTNIVERCCPTILRKRTDSIGPSSNYGQVARVLWALGTVQSRDSVSSRGPSNCLRRVRVCKCTNLRQNRRMEIHLSDCRSYLMT
jgi:hypothetical protein